MLILPIACIPATLFLLITTARYLMVAQPFMFASAAIAHSAASDAFLHRWSAQ